MANEAVIYTRLSAARVGDDETLDDQERTCRQLAESHSLRVAEVFSEGSGVSAFKKNVARPELDALIAFVRQNPGSVVIAWEISRLTRRLSDLSSWIDLVDDFDARIITPQLDTAQSGGRLMLSIMATMAEEESRQKSSRVKDGKRRQREAGQYLGGHAPPGYTKVEGGLEIHLAESEALREAARLYVDERLSLRAIAMKFNESGSRTQRGALWNAQVLRRVFTSPLTAGMIAQTDGSLKAAAGLAGGGVLTLERLHKIKLRMESRSKKATSLGARRPASSLLSAGLLRCGGCSSGMTSNRLSTGSDYRCSKYTDGSCDNGVSIRAHLVEPPVILEALKRIDAAQAAAAHEDDWVALDRIFETFKSLNNPEDDLRRSQLQAERSDLLSRESHINDVFLGGSLSAEGHRAALDKLKASLEAAESALSSLPDPSTSHPLPINAGDWLNQLADGEITNAELPAAFLTACGSLEVARDVLKAVFESITLNHRKAGLKPVDRLVFV